MDEILAEKQWTNLIASFVGFARSLEFLQLFQQEGLVFSLLRKVESGETEEEISKLLLIPK